MEKEEQERLELEQEEDEHEAEQEFDQEKWMPTSQMDERAMKTPPYIEQFSESKVHDLLIFQIQEILTNCEDQIRLNSKKF